MKRAAKKSKTKKTVPPYKLDQSFATNPLKTVADIRVIQTILGHHSIKTNEVYTPVANKNINIIKSPLD